MIPPSIIGIIGATTLLVAFVLNQVHRLKDTDFTYDLMNAIGGILLVIYAIQIDSIPFAVLNAVWGIVSVKDVYTDLRKKKP